MPPQLTSATPPSDGADAPLPTATLLAGSAIAVPVGVACGCGSAVFLTALQAVTNLRTEQTWLVWLLPVAGWLMGWVWTRWGEGVAAGSDLVLDRAVVGGPPIQARMAPMVVLGTVATHLFGGSAGREGTAVQMGAALGSVLASALGVPVALGAGVGFAAVFAAASNAPLALSVMAVELLGVALAPHVAVVALTAWLVTGRRSLYETQRDVERKPSIVAWIRRLRRRRPGRS